MIVFGKYICPMCPSVVEDNPVPCPHCGMALEQVVSLTAARQTRYICPMHAQIIQDEPGNCPICGMSLEPMAVVEDGLKEGLGPEGIEVLAVLLRDVRLPQRFKEAIEAKLTADQRVKLVR